MRPRILGVILAVFASPAVAQEIPTTSGDGILSKSDGMGTDGTASDAASMTVENQRRYVDGGKVKLKGKDGKVVTAGPINPDPNGELAALAQRRRGDALGLAARVKGGAQVPAELAPKLRQSLDDDLTLWARQFAVEPAEVASVRQTWLPPLQSRSSQEWILARAAWYETRDQWIAKRQTAAR